ncbi:MAG TPA: HAMP domain-containing sensor histidine kinase [Lacunisphaera sp.]|nr:HAMP domain-containing sensor histidine kinase [Lacunisphaera sp.]
MKSTSVYLVDLAEAVREMALLAARETFPRAQLIPVRSVDEAIRLPGQDRQLLVVGEVSEAEIGLAAQAMAAGDLPRWAVVHIGREPSDLVETVAPEECSVRILARIFRAAVLHHELLRENLQLRGDLRTVARRFNHDIRTPLGCIDAACTLFQEAASAGGSARQAAEMLSTIRSSTAEIDALLGRVSLVLKASGEPLPVQPVAMGPVVERVVAEATAAPERRGVKIRQPASWPDVRGVEKWIEFAWTTLIQNAVRHGAKGGAIQLGWEPRGSELRFWVSSLGAVPVSLQPNLLRPFHLLHQQPSAGLGLSLVERLVALQGGRTGYESTPDNRALFHFSLPANPAGVGTMPAARPLSATGSRG